MIRRCLAAATVVVALVGLLIAARPAAAQQSGQARTILVDEDGSYEVLVHPDFVTIIYLPDKVDKAIASDVTSYEVKSIGPTSLAIRPLKVGSKPASLAVATPSIKVSVVLRMVTNRDEAMTQVTFKRADLEAEFERRIAEKVKERTHELELKMAAMQQQMDAELPKLAEGLVAARMLKRREVRKLNAIERNDDNVVVETKDVLYLGDDAYVTFEVENRDKSPYRVGAVTLRDGKLDQTSAVRFSSDAAETAGAGVIGVVRPGGRGTGVVVVRRSADVTGKPLTLEISQPGGRGKVIVDRIVLR